MPQLAVFAQALPLILTVLETLLKALNSPENQAFVQDVKTRLAALEQQHAAFQAQTTIPPAA